MAIVSGAQLRRGWGVSDVRLTVAARSDVGRVRTNNEDAFNITDLATGTSLTAERGAGAIDVRDKGVLLALSDGMGGHQAGEVASALVLESLRAAMQAGAANSIEVKIEAAVRRANADVARAARTDNKSGMGATLTAVFIGGVDAYVAEVGDSRAYLLRSGRLRQITRDQSLVQMMVDKGLLSKEDAKISPHKNVILQAMGLADDVRVAIARLHLRRGDRLLLCSDGLSNMLSDDELREILGGADATTACERLIDRGNELGGEDNITAIVAEIDGEGLAAPRAAESVTATFQVIQDFADLRGESPAAPERHAEPGSPIPNPIPLPIGPERPVRSERPRAAAPAVVPAPRPAAPSRTVLIAVAAVAVVGLWFLMRWLVG
jgi:serine/threonine protein phosphatase PrpC